MVQVLFQQIPNQDPPRAGRCREIPAAIIEVTSQYFSIFPEFLVKSIIFIPKDSDFRGVRHIFIQIVDYKSEVTDNCDVAIAANVAAVHYALYFGIVIDHMHTWAIVIIII